MTLFPGAPYEYASSAGDLVFTAGACPLDADGHIIGAGDLEAQAAQAVDNLLTALTAEGCDASDLLKTTIFVVGKERADLVTVWRTVSIKLGRAPSTLLGVSFLGYPEQLVEIEAVAARRRKA